MTQAGKIVLVAFFVALLPGCASKKAKVKPPAIAQAPTTNDQAGVMYPTPFPPTTEAPPLPAPALTQPKEAAPPSPPPEHQPSKRKKNAGTLTKPKPSAAKPATQAPGTSESAAPATPSVTTATPGQQTANVEPSGVSPIGQLTSGEGASGSQKRHDTSDLINTTEQGLNGIKRTLDRQESETANQIRTYLKQAKNALTVDDIDGASTLATKAKVLLEELTKP